MPGPTNFLDIATDRASTNTGIGSISVRTNRYAAVLAANTATVLSVPANKRRCIISATNDIYIDYDAVAVIPTQSTFTNANIPMLNRAGLLGVEEDTQMTFIAPVQTTVVVEFFDN